MIPLIGKPARVPIRQFFAGRAPLARFRGLEVHCFHGLQCEALLDEVGRLRELGFRAAGAGRGLAKDLDALDLEPLGYEQLVVWDETHEELVAMLRFQMGWRTQRGGLSLLRTHRLFEYTTESTTAVLPGGMEPGRSIVHSAARRARFGLYALWTGLGQLIFSRNVETLFGNVTIYADYPPAARTALVGLVESLYGGENSPLRARPALRFVGASAQPAPRRQAGESKLQHLQKALRQYGASVPTMLQIYLQLGPKITCGQTAYDGDFGGALELGIVVLRAAIGGPWRKVVGLCSDPPTARQSL